jgi:hypothetical protein
MKVGVNHSGYPEKRNIIDLPFRNVKIVKIVDVFKLVTHFIFKGFNRVNYYTLNSFYGLGLKKSNINHFFNGISFSNTPWVTTFERTLPNYSNDFKFMYDAGVYRLNHNSCKKK